MAKTLGETDIKDISIEQLKAAFAKQGITPQNPAQSKAATPTLPTLQATQDEASKANALAGDDDPVSKFANLNAALNKAVSLARNKRQDQNLDFLGKTVPVGSVGAGTFTSLLSDLNTAFDKEAIPLAESTLDFARDQEDRAAQAKTDIQNLGISLLEAKVKPEAIQTVLAFTESGDINGAMIAASTALQNSPAAKDFDIRTVGDQIIGIDKETGDAEVLFTGTGGGGGGGGGGFGGDTGKSEFQLAKDYAASFEGTDEQLKQDLLQGADKLSVSEVSSIVNARPIGNRDDARLQNIAIGWATYYYSGKGKKGHLGVGDEGEFSIAKSAALDLADTGQWKPEGKATIQLSPEEVKAIKKAINNLTLDQIQ